MKKDPKYFLNHILESIKLIEEYTKGIDKEEFVGSTVVHDAVLRRLEIIGEAAKNIPTEIKSQHKEVPWNLMAGMRDVLIHEYFGIESYTIWTTIKEDLPNLARMIKEILKTIK